MIEVSGDNITKEFEEMVERLRDLTPIDGAIHDEFLRQNPIVRPGHPMNVFGVSGNMVSVGSQSESFAALLEFDEGQLFDNVVEAFIIEGV